MPLIKLLTLLCNILSRVKSINRQPIAKVIQSRAGSIDQCRISQSPSLFCSTIPSCRLTQSPCVASPHPPSPHLFISNRLWSPCFASCSIKPVMFTAVPLRCLSANMWPPCFLLWTPICSNKVFLVSLDSPISCMSRYARNAHHYPIRNLGYCFHAPSSITLAGMSP